MSFVSRLRLDHGRLCGDQRPFTFQLQIESSCGIGISPGSGLSSSRLRCRTHIESDSVDEDKTYGLSHEDRGLLTV